MLEAAEKGDWESVAKGEQERIGLLEQFFGHPARPDETAYVDAGIRRLLGINERIAELGRAGMAASSAGLERLGRGRRAQRAYDQNLTLSEN